MDEYLRTKWQPRMTQFEQQLHEAAPALALVDDFRNDPAATLQAVAAEVWDDNPELVAKIVAAFGEPAPPAEPTAPAAARDPEVEEMLTDYQNRQRADAYNASITALKASHPEDTTINNKTLAPFVVSANGNFEAAYAGYQAFVAELRQTTGMTQAQAADAVAGFQAPAAPAILGSAAAGGGAAPPPVAKRYSSLDEALDDAIAEAKEARQPVAQPVGTV